MYIINLQYSMTEVYARTEVRGTGKLQAMCWEHQWCNYYLFSYSYTSVVFIRWLRYKVPVIHKLSVHRFIHKIQYSTLVNRWQHDSLDKKCMIRYNVLGINIVWNNGTTIKQILCTDFWSYKFKKFKKMFSDLYMNRNIVTFPQHELCWKIF